MIKLKIEKFHFDEHVFIEPTTLILGKRDHGNAISYLVITGVDMTPLNKGLKGLKEIEKEIPSFYYLGASKSLRKAFEQSILKSVEACQDKNALVWLFQLDPQAVFDINEKAYFEIEKYFSTLK